MAHILVSNDDGVGAAGIASLIEGLRNFARVSVVVPDADRSAASSAITLRRDLAVKIKEKDFYTVDGTPADCTHLAFTGLLDSKPDLVISGINAGKNLGEDVIYSGTVGAAREGPLFGVSAIAVSLIAGESLHFDTATKVTEALAKTLLREKPARPVFLNVNVPNLPIDKIRGIRVTRLGLRGPACPATLKREENGTLFYRFGNQGLPLLAGCGTDFDAIEKGYVSLTPLKIDGIDSEWNLDCKSFLEKLGI